MADQLAEFRDRFDDYRAAIVNEPRGFDAMVGALLCKPVDSACVAGVIFFNNAGYLHMCGHGTIGVAVTLMHQDKIGPGVHRLETPVGEVSFEIEDANRVTIMNVPSYRHAKDVTVNVEDMGPITGDVAWGGNWFFLVADHGQSLALSNVDELTCVTSHIRDALVSNGISGADGAEIDHIELFGAAIDPMANSRNFVLCPGREYDRSPCGTGTSAKIACLAADGKLGEGDIWRQEGISGESFTASFRKDGDQVIPSITGSAYIVSEGTLIVDPNDPFGCGLSK
jgi:4-hydroxyproline epimerase